MVATKALAKLVSWRLRAKSAYLVQQWTVKTMMPFTRGSCVERSSTSATLSVSSPRSYRYAPFATHALSHASSRAHSVDDRDHANMACRAQDTGYLLSEKSLMDINQALADVGLESRAALPSEIVLHRFFEQARSIACVVDLLRKGTWNEDLKSSGVTLDTLLVTQVLRCDIPCDVALSFFQWLKGVRRFKHSEYTYGVMLNMLGRAGRLREMQQLFDEMKENGCMVTPVTLSNVMLWYFRAKDMREVAKYWNRMRRSRTKPSAAIYAAYIDFLARTKRYTKIAVIFEEMLRVNCLPSSRVYTVFVRHLVEIGNVEAAAKILQTMQTMRLVPSRATYRIVINGFAKAGDIEGVLKLLDELKEHFHRPTKQFMPAIHALQAGGKSKEATRLLEEISPDSAQSANDMVDVSDEEDDATSDSECSLTEWRAISCLHAGFDVNAFAQALHSWGPKVEEMLEQANVQWGRSLVMRVLKQLRNVDCLWPFFHWLKDKAGFKHDRYSCALLIQQILKSKSTLKKKSSLVRDLFEGMRSEGVRFTAPMFNLVMRHYVAGGEGERAFDTFEFMKQFEVEPNSVSYTLVIQGCAKNHQVERATELLEEMKRKGFHLNSSTCAQFITCLGSVGKLGAAYELFQGVSASGRSASSVEYKAMMAAYARVGDYAMALQLYDQMREAGIAPTQDMYELVMKVLQQAKRHADMNALARERVLLNFFDGKKKVLQERLLQVLFLFMESVKKPRKTRKSHLRAAS